MPPSIQQASSRTALCLSVRLSRTARTPGRTRQPTLKFVQTAVQNNTADREFSTVCYFILIVSGSGLHLATGGHLRSHSADIGFLFSLSLLAEEGTFLLVTLNFNL